MDQWASYDLSSVVAVDPDPAPDRNGLKPSAMASELRPLLAIEAQIDTELSSCWSRYRRTAAKGTGNFKDSVSQTN